MKSLNELFRDVILENELSGNEKAALKFSLASKKSGYSFGVSQLDISHSDNAVKCLKECGFSDIEIEQLQNKEVDPKQFTQRLINNADVIKKWDEIQLSHCLEAALNFITSNGLATTGDTAILAVADYWNQYGSMGTGALRFFKGLGRPLSEDDVLKFKLKYTTYGEEDPEDCQRRHDNLIKVMKEEN